VKRHAIGLAASLLTGCAGWGWAPDYAAVEPGTRIHFDQTLIAGEYGNLWFQDGERRDYYDIERRPLRPYCRFRTGLDEGEPVPRRWTVTDFELERRDTHRISPRFNFGPDAEIPILEYRSIMTLVSDDGRRASLICSQEYDAGWVRYVENDRIPEVIGHGVSFIPPATGNPAT
jgi:hypothetical protein